MDPVTIALLTSLAASAIGAGGQAYLGNQAQNAAEREGKRNRKEDTRRFNLDEARNMRNEPIQQAAALENIRQSVLKPSSYDFLSSLNSRYANA
jgi:hypothetical protein